MANQVLHEHADIPLIIIGSDVLDTNGNAALAGLQTARHEQLRAVAAQSAQGEFVVAERSSHNVLTERPDVVLEAIVTLWKASVDLPGST